MFGPLDSDCTDMQKSRVKFAGHFILMVPTCLAIHGCRSEEASFSGKNDNSQNAVVEEAGASVDPTPTNAPSVPTPTKAPPVLNGFVTDTSETFPLSRNKSGKVDIIWVVDNSGSMVEEAANVRKNFDNFVTSLSGQTDLKMMLISSSVATATNVQLSSAARAAGHVQVDEMIGSWQSLASAAAAICPAAATTDSAVCGVPYVFESGGVPFQVPSLSAKGSLISNVRPEANKVFVFVTDDNAKYFKESQFVQAVGSVSGFESFTVFAYTYPAGAGSNSKCSGSPGTEYDLLTKQTGGKSFSICSTDWSKDFDELKQSVESIANNKFKLSKKIPLKVLEVKIGGKVIDSSGWVFSRGAVVVYSSAIPENAVEVEITYRYATISP